MPTTIEIAPSLEHTTIYGNVFYGYIKNRDGSRTDYKFVADDENIRIAPEAMDAWKDLFSMSIFMCRHWNQIEYVFKENGIPGKFSAEEIK